MPFTISLDWSVIIAAIAVALSQLPPISIWFKKAKLDLELYSKISLTHKVGNPNLQAHLIIRNIGGRNIRVKDIKVTLTKDGRDLVSLPVQNYLQNQTDQNTLLFTTFSLAPNEEWAYIANFLNFFDRPDEIKFQEIHGEMLADLSIKKEALEGTTQDKLIEHDEAITEKAIEFFNSKFIWNSGEYVMLVTVITDNSKLNISKKFRFTIFENHTNQLKEITEKFKVGAGIYWNPNNVSSGVILPIFEI